MSDENDLSAIMADASEDTIESEIATETVPPRPLNLWVSLVLPVAGVALVLFGVYYFALAQG